MSDAVSTSASATGNAHYCMSRANPSQHRDAYFGKDAEVEALLTYAESNPELPHDRLEHVVQRATEALDKVRTENPHHFSSIMTRGVHTFHDRRAVTYNGVWAELFLQNEYAKTSKEWRTFYSRLFKLYNTHRSSKYTSHVYEV
ncbi:hypothetical protein IWX49DRAFT_552808 [Phyllosticta citricarpa]